MAIRTLIAATLLSLPFMGSLSEAAVVFDQQTSAGGSVATSNLPDGRSFDATLSWLRVGNPTGATSAYVRFTSDATMQLYYTDLQNLDPTFPVSMSLQEQDSGGNDIGAALVFDPFNDGRYDRTCAGSPLPELDGDCTALDLVGAPTLGDILMFTLTAGTYRLGVTESGVSSVGTGQAGFRIIDLDDAPIVPLPSTALLMIGALGGLAGLRARHKRS